MRHTRSIGRRGRLILGTAILTVALGASIPIVMAQLTDSSFESSDGNLAVDTGGNHDWNSPLQAITCPATPPGAGTNCGTDLAKSGSDDAFGQGAKEDGANPSEVFGSIPPQKSDLTRFYVNKEKSNNKDFLYLAWERTNILGSANMDFEFNQSATLATGKHTPLRTAGDLLITFDVGSGDPVLGVLKWVTSGSKNQCFSANALPCWGNRVDLSASGFADGKINTATVSDTNGPNAPFDLPGGTFGEAGINLTDAGVFPQNVCTHFGSAFLKSRSSSSFPAELKDFIAPIPVDIANCGGLSVEKYIDIDEDGSQDSGERPTSIAADVSGWSFTVSGPNNLSCTGTTNASGVLSDCRDANNQVVNLGTLQAGSYTVTENANAGKTIGTNSSAFFNTDPGSKPATPPVSTGVSVGVNGTTTVDFGNSCYATANFAVSNVPSGQSGLFARYTVNNELTSHDVALAQDGQTTTYRASVGGLRMGDVIHWSYGINQGGQGEQTSAATDITLVGYPSCSGSGTVAFETATVNGSKYKDINGNGTKDAGEGPLQGFKFQLLKNGTQVGSDQLSAANGTFSFASVAPGTYTIHEVGPPTGWVQTQPSSGDVTVTVALGDSSVTADPFGNTPLSTVTVTLNPLAKLRNADGTASTTDATKAKSITCTDSLSANVGSTTTANTKTTDSVQIKQSAVSCVVEIEDP